MELPAAISERLHSSVLEAPLVSSHSARGAIESLRHIILVSQALLNQSDHRIGFAHTVSQRILCKHDPGDDYRTATIMGSDLASIVNHANDFELLSV
jgi:hypothetical protein